MKRVKIENGLVMLDLLERLGYGQNFILEYSAEPIF
jgi:hypothetical protein